jgi:hypothetical protein
MEQRKLLLECDPRYQKYVAENRKAEHSGGNSGPNGHDAGHPARIYHRRDRTTLASLCAGWVIPLASRWEMLITRTRTAGSQHSASQVFLQYMAHNV